MEFVRPWNWRAGQRLPGASEAAEAAPCPVRGVIDARERKLYYVPTDREYRKVSVDRAKGERLFCSDVEARKAGWLRPGEIQPAR